MAAPSASEPSPTPRRRAPWRALPTTGAIVNSHYLSRRYGLDRDFDHFRYLREDMNTAEPSGVEKEAEAWLDEIGDRPFFLFLHFYGPHSDYKSLPRFEEMFARPYDGLVDGSTRQLRAFRDGEFPLGDEDVRHLVDLYVAGIRQVDEEIGRLLDDLEARGLDKTTLVIVTSDHGEEFLEHGGVLHGRTLYEELLRVPLVMRGPGVPEGVRVEEPVSLVDIEPTILSLLGAAPSPTDGVDLSTLWEDGAAAADGARFLFGEADHSNEENDILRAARCGTYKLIFDRLTGDAALYDLSRDPEESKDVGDDEPGVRERLAEALEAHLSASSPEKDLPDLSPEEIEHLKSLGYF